MRKCDGCNENGAAIVVRFGEVEKVYGECCVGELREATLAGEVEVVVFVPERSVMLGRVIEAGGELGRRVVADAESLEEYASGWIGALTIGGGHEG